MYFTFQQYKIKEYSNYLVFGNKENVIRWSNKQTYNMNVRHNRIMLDNAVCFLLLLSFSAPSVAPLVFVVLAMLV